MSVDFAGMLEAVEDAFGVDASLIYDRQEQGTAARPTMDVATGQRRRAVDRYDVKVNVLPATQGMSGGGGGVPSGERQYVVRAAGLPSGVRAPRAGDELRLWRVENQARIDTVVARVVEVSEQVGGQAYLLRCVQDRTAAPSVLGR
ncbi:MAG: hypothetical protein LW650_10815 [Planctomycetaceae bacterium]|jgi:hypothetical protein|nr:hypothetical protein [Phycisphaerales bacterium]MCE2653942.1 hypothetical protein [Planctomycetaceae bacterium]